MVNSAARSVRSASFIESAGITAQKPWMDFLFMMMEKTPGVLISEEFGRHVQTLNALVMNLFTFVDTRYSYWMDKPALNAKGKPQKLSAKQLLELDYSALMHPRLSARCNIALTFWWWSVLDTHRQAKIPEQYSLYDTTRNCKLILIMMENYANLFL
jgi:hypothetical protein